MSSMQCTITVDWRTGRRLQRSIITYGPGKYHAICPWLSVLIVFGLLCAGAGYYAKVTGKLAFLHQIYGDARQKNIKVIPISHLPVPSTTRQQGPASKFIPSATTASRFDTEHNV